MELRAPWSGGRGPCPWQGVGLDGLQGPLHPKPSADSMIDICSTGSWTPKGVVHAAGFPFNAVFLFQGGKETEV